MKTVKDLSTSSESGYEIEPAEILCKTPIVTIQSGPVLCKRNGKRKDFVFFDFPDWVNVVAVTHKEEIVLIRQFRYGSRRMEMEIPGGMVEHGEDPVTAGCRELLEETGYAGKGARIIGKVCPNPAIQRNYCHTVLVEDAQQVAEPRFDDMENIACVVETRRRVLEHISTGKIDHGLVLNALMFYFGLSVTR